MNLKIVLPILEVKRGAIPYYAFVVTDSANVEHYFVYDGTYDGYSHAPCVDYQTGRNLN